jgi:hypothetical protein
MRAIERKDAAGAKSQEVAVRRDKSPNDSRRRPLVETLQR